MIALSDISVVVQGPIAGKPGEPDERRLTLKCLESVRRFLPGAEVVLSTWRNSDLTGLSFDRLVESDDPGAMLTTNELTTARIYYNANRQIVSTRAGLQAATRPLAVKLRSDMTLTGTGFLDYFRRYTARNERWKILRDRVVTGTLHARNPRRKYPFPFHPSDWFHFGWREDVLNIWDLPLASEPEIPRWHDTRPRPPGDPCPWEACRYTVEQYTWTSFLRKHGELRFEHRMDFSHDAINVSELTIANNLVLVESSELGIKFIKYPVSKMDWASVYSHGEWLRLYRKYCDPAVACPPDVVRWQKRAARVGYHTFEMMERLRQSDALIKVRRAWERTSPGSLRVAKRVFQVVFDTPRVLAMYDKAGKREDPS